MNILSYIEDTSSEKSLEILSLSSKLLDENSKHFVYCNFFTENKDLENYNIEKIFIKNKTDIFDNIEILYNSIIENKITKIVAPQTDLGSKFAGIFAGKLNIPLLSNVIEINKNKVTQSTFSGRLHSQIDLNEGGFIVLINKGSFLNDKGVESKNKFLTEEISINKEQKFKISNIKNVKNNSANLLDSKVVISGGRGMESKENWSLLEKLAKKINSGLACSKPISDNKWRPHNEHVGQTGEKISPDLYIAVGISGSIQHTAGISNSKKILAINKSKEAPIFNIANYGIVGDIKDILPKLIEKL